MARPSRDTAPTERLARLCDAAITAFETHPEHTPKDKAIIFVDSDEDKRAGLVLHGYEDDLEAVANLLVHLKAIMEANGKTLIIAPLGNNAPEQN